MKNDPERIYTVQVRREVITTVEVTARNAEDACAGAVVLAPPVPGDWTIQRTKMLILNVSTD